MTLIVNEERVNERLILEELERLRPEYQRVFGEQSPDEQEARLQEWSRENVIEHTLIRQAAERDARPIPEERIESEFRKFVQEEAQGERPDMPGEEEERIRAGIEKRLRVQRFIDEAGSGLEDPGEPELRRYFGEHSEQFVRPERVHAAHIVKHPDAGTTREDARAFMLRIRERLDAGESFEALADESSDCPDNGGDLGWFPRGQMVPRFEEKVFAMSPGDVSEVFETEFGFHVAKVYERRDPESMTFEDAREQVEKQYREAAGNAALEAAVDRLREEASVEFAVDDSLQLMFDRSRAGADRMRYPKTLSSLLVKPAGPDCNMSCRYCFYLEKEALFRGKQHRMPEEVLEEMIRQAMVQSGEHLSIGWQGGEPTLMGIPFFEKAVAFQKKYGLDQTVGNGLQTNGLLIDDAWAQFLKENRFLVGLSMDGPEHIHDHYRRDRGGKGTWERVKNSAELLLQAGVSVNALSVVNAYSARFPEEIYRFHKSMGLDFMQFIPCVETDPQDGGKAAPFSVSPEVYGTFLCRVFDLWNEDFVDGRPATSVRFFEAMLHQYVGQRPPECTLYEECGIYVVVEHNGDVYACDFFVGPEWKLGNVMEDRLVDLLNSERQNAFGRMKSRLPSDCVDCRWLRACRGGCTKDRLRDPRDEKRSHFCEAYRMFFEHADARFVELADLWKRNAALESRQKRIRESVGRGETQPNRNDPCPCGSGAKFKRCCGSVN